MFFENDNCRELLLSEFAAKLPSVRKKLKMSQSELGGRVGLSRQSISSVERGMVPLAWNTFLAIVLVVLVNEPDVLKRYFFGARFFGNCRKFKEGH